MKRALIAALLFLCASAQAAEVAKQKIGSGGRGAWVFTPAPTRPASAPVVVFLHGYRAVDPYGYGGWIDHLARQGNSVIYPIYENAHDDSDDEIMRNLLAGVRAGFDHLEQKGPRPDRSKVVFMGHSFGGGLAAQLAARAHKEGLPTPKAVLMAQPGWRGSDEYPAGALTDIPGSMFMLVVDGSQDQFADSRQGGIILCGARNVPRSRKAHLVLEAGDGRIADHYAPLSPHADYRLEEKTGRMARRERFVKKAVGIREGEIDELDRKGFWRLFDAVQRAAFRADDNIEGALGGAGEEGAVRTQILQQGC